MKVLLISPKLLLGLCIIFSAGAQMEDEEEELLMMAIKQQQNKSPLDMLVAQASQGAEEGEEKLLKRLQGEIPSKEQILSAVEEELQEFEQDEVDRFSLLEEQIRLQNERIEEIEKNAKEQKTELQSLKSREEAKDRQLHEARDEIALLKSKVSRLESVEIARMQASRVNQQQPPPVSGPPTSCRDLNYFGHNFNGFYLVQGKGAQGNKVQTIYCIFNKAGYEKRLGSVDIKSGSGVQFHVQRTTSLPGSNVTVTYQVATTMIGNGMNLNTGVFTSNVNGTYRFSFAAVKGDATLPLEFFLRHNGVAVGAASARDLNSTAVIEATLKLKARDRVDVLKMGGAPLFDDARRLTHFSGVLLEEDMSL